MAGRNCCKCVTVSLVPTASLILVILFACGIILLPVLFIELTVDYKYGIIIDAGSSHTKLYGYKWRIPAAQNATGAIDVTEIYSKYCKGSLNSYVSNPKGVSDAISLCLNESESSVFLSDNKDTVQYTPVFLGATAGMRILNMTNKTASDAIFNEVRKTLRNSKYNFTDNQQARIISGEEEAVGGWTTANYLTKHLNPPDVTTGALDLGGASTQIAFDVSGGSSPSYPTSAVTLFDKTYTLYARSYLCYGENEAYSRFLAHLHSQQQEGNITTNPCMINGANVSYHHSNVYTGCVNITSRAAIEAFGFGLAPPTSLGADDDITFIGTWDPKQCWNEINAVFNFSKCSPEKNCQSNTNFTAPPAKGNFVGFSGFYYTANFFNLSESNFNNTNSWDVFRAVVDKNCSSSKNDSCVVKGKVKKSCYKYCFNGLFNTFVLENGFGFSNKSSGNWSVVFKENIRINNEEEVSVGWALGYMLNETNTIDHDHYVEIHPYSAVDLVVGMLILSILCVVFVIFFFLTFYACRKSLRARSGFQPL